MDMIQNAKKNDDDELKNAKMMYVSLYEYVI